MRPKRQQKNFKGEQREKQDRKIAPLSFPPLYQFHVWKSRGATALCCPRCRRPCMWFSQKGHGNAVLDYRKKN